MDLQIATTLKPRKIRKILRLSGQLQFAHKCMGYIFLNKVIFWKLKNPIPNLPYENPQIAEKNMLLDLQALGKYCKNNEQKPSPNTKNDITKPFLDFCTNSVL